MYVLTFYHLQVQRYPAKTNQPIHIGKTVYCFVKKILQKIC